jgi:hypothetical protein
MVYIPSKIGKGGGDKKRHEGAGLLMILNPGKILVFGAIIMEPS